LVPAEKKEGGKKYKQNPKMQKNTQTKLANKDLYYVVDISGYETCSVHLASKKKAKPKTCPLQSE